MFRFRGFLNYSLICIVASLLSAPLFADTRHQVRADKVIVKFKQPHLASGKSLSGSGFAKQALLTSIGTTNLKQHQFPVTATKAGTYYLANGASTPGNLTIDVLELDGSHDIQTVIKILESSGMVEYAEPDYRVTALLQPNDPDLPLLWGLENTGQIGTDDDSGLIDADIDATEAWEITTGTQHTIVAVIDTGIDYTHEDLVENMWSNPGEIPGDGIDNDGNGYIDDIHGINCADGSGDPMDDNHHGTHVSGTIGARGNNGIGVSGVNGATQLMGLKFLDAAGDGDLSDAIECLAYAVNMKNNYGVNVRIINNSWGGGGFSQAMLEAIQASNDANMLFIASAGNKSRDNDTHERYPAGYNVENIISVAATTKTDLLSNASNYGSLSVDLGAPGNDILSTTPGNHYQRLSGTSMATPHVSGAAALLWDHDPSLSAIDLKNLLLFTGDDLDVLQGVTTTGKRLNVNNALICIPGNPQLKISAPGSDFTLPNNNPATIRASIFDCGTPVLATVVTANPGNGDAEFTLIDNGLLPDMVANDGIYAGIWNVVNRSSDMTFTVTSGELSSSIQGKVVDPSDFNYAMDPEFAFEWVDTSDGELLTDADVDDGKQITGIGFNFHFAGNNYSQISVSSNGLLTFKSNTNSDYQNQAIPVADTHNGLLAVYWDDLNPGTQGDIQKLISGEAPNRNMTITWNEIIPRNGASHLDIPENAITFQATLYEGSNDIVYRYLDTDSTLTPIRSHGNRATIGLEHHDGVLGLQYLFNGENHGLPVQVNDGQAIRFYISAETDNTPPVISLNGDTVLKLSSGDSYAEPGATAIDSTDGVLEVAISGTVDDNTTAEHLIIYTATDAAGNTATTTRTVIVDVTPPIIALNDNAIIRLPSGGSYAEPGATAIDSTDEAVEVTISGTVDDTITAEYLIIYTATDAAGNTATTTRTVIVDVTPPVIALNGNPTTKLYAGDTYVEPGAIAIDSIDEDVAVTITGTVDASISGEYIITYMATDAAGNSATTTRTVIVDLTLPVISLNGDTVIRLFSGNSYTEPGATALDNQGEVVDVTINGTVDNDTTGKYIITYIAIDTSGNTTTITRTVIVDLTSPVIVLNGNTTIRLTIGDSYTEQGATALDNIDGDVEVSMSGTVDISVAGEYSISYVATDTVGNSSTVTRSIIVVEQQSQGTDTPDENSPQLQGSGSSGGGSISWMGLIILCLAATSRRLRNL